MTNCQETEGVFLGLWFQEKRLDIQLSTEGTEEPVKFCLIGN